MTGEVVGGADEAEHDERRKQAARNMHAALREFMERYDFLFPCVPKPDGKLGAFFKWKDARSTPDSLEMLKKVLVKLQGCNSIPALVPRKQLLSNTAASGRCFGF